VVLTKQYRFDAGRAVERCDPLAPTAGVVGPAAPGSSAASVRIQLSVPARGRGDEQPEASRRGQESDSAPSRPPAAYARAMISGQLRSLVTGAVLSLAASV
jgi:hypothetical protein